MRHHMSEKRHVTPHFNDSPNEGNGITDNTIEFQRYV